MLTFTSIELIVAVVPVARPLKIVLNPLKRFLKKYGDKPILRAIGGVLGNVAEQAAQGKFDKIGNLLPYIFIVSEMIAEPEGLEALDFMVEAIGSTDDLWAWIDYFNLPADGWEGDEVPEVAMLSAELPPVDLFTFIIPNAYAKPIKGKLVGAKALIKLLKALKKMDDKFLEGEGRAIVDGIKSLTKELKSTNIKGLRKLAFSPQTLIAAVGVGGHAIRNIMRRMNNLRMSPLAILATVSYLESRKGSCTDIPNCKPFINEVPERINSLYKTAFLKVVTGQRQYTGNQAQGALFNLAMIAVKHLEYETTKSEARKIIAVQQPFDIQLYIKSGNRITAFGGTIGRISDIVLSGNEGDNYVSKKSELVEVKSLLVTKISRKNKNAKNKNWQSAWGLWNVRKTDSYQNHREFYLDRVATQNNPLVPDVDTQKAAKYEWWIQSFNRIGIRGYEETSEMPYVYDQLRKLPRGNGVAAVSLGFSTRAEHDRTFNENDVKSDVKIFNIKHWLTSTAKNALLDGIGTELIDELITTSDEF